VNALPSEVTAAVLACGGRGSGDEIVFRCPSHDDQHPSASWNTAKGVWTCHACGARGGAKDLATRLGIAVDTPAPCVPRSARGPAAFTAADAQRAWTACHERARDDDDVDEDRAAYAFLATRGLSEAWDEPDQVGIVPSRRDLPAAMRTWRARGYHLVAPLYDLDGQLAGIQARAVADLAQDAPKTIFPRGLRAAGLVFANRAGLRLLRGERLDTPCVVLGEGLTDSLAFAIATALPVLCAPGTNMASRCIGPWVWGRVLVIALDDDRAGEQVVEAVADAAYHAGARFVHRLEWPTPTLDACDVLTTRGVVGLATLLDGVEVRCA